MAFSRFLDALVRRALAARERAETERKGHRVTIALGAKLHASSRVHNARTPEYITIGEYSHIMGTLEVRPQSGRIDIGSHVFIGEGSYIWSAASIQIGDRVLISHGVNIHDSGSHPISAKGRHQHFRATLLAEGEPDLTDVEKTPITIKDDAWIGFGAIVLRGVTIGRGAIVGAGSVVTNDVGDYEIVVGNPARVVGEAKR